MSLRLWSRVVISVASCAAVLVSACSPSAAPAPTSAAAKPTTAPAASGSPAASPAASPGAAASPAANAGASAAAKPSVPEAEITAQLDKYYQAAKSANELRVTHYGLGPEYDPLIKAFQQKYPGVSVEAVNLRGPEMIQRINAEASSGKYVGNVASTGLTTMGEIERQGRLVQWIPPNGPALPIPEGGSDNYRWMFTVGLYGIIVNTDLVPADKFPKTRQDLLDPFFKGKGKLFSEDPRAAGPGQSFWVLAYDDIGPDYLQKLKDQGITFTRDRDAAPAQVARGEYAMYFAASVNQEILDLEHSAPVKTLFFRDGGTHYTDVTAGVIKDAPGQGAAKLWISWMTSPEGQRELVNKVNVYPALPGLPAPGGWPSFAEIGGKQRTAEQRSRNDEYVAKFDNIFFK